MTVGKTLFATALCAGIALTCQAITHIDVLVAYDTTATKWMVDAGLDQQTFAEGQVAKANGVLNNSGLGEVFDFRLVGIHTGAFSYQNMDLTLDAAVESKDSSWAALHSDRDKAGADIVVVLVDADVTSGQTGNSTALEPYAAEEGKELERKYNLDFPGAQEYLKWFAERAYAVVDIASAKNGYAFVHEIGHVMGAGHSESLLNGPGPQLFSYSAAMMMQGSDANYYATVMGYSATGHPGSATYKVLPYFSSPEVVYPETGDALGDATHNNALTLRNTYAKVAVFRSEAKSSDSDTTPGTTPVAPSNPDSDTTPDTTPVAPSNPDRVAVGFTAKKTTIIAAVKDEDAIIGIAEFVVAATKKGESKVSGSIFGIDGKKKSVKGKKCKVYDNGDGVARVTLDGVAVKGMEGTLSVTLGGDMSLFNGSIGSLSLVSASRGFDSSMSAADFYIAEIPDTIMGDEVVQSAEYGGDKYSLLPSVAEPEKVSLGTRWTVAKGGKVKFKDGKFELAGSRNFSLLKLSYQEKTGTFKGSFTMYVISGGKLKKLKFNVTGVVVDGEGIGVANCKKAGLTLDVFVKFVK